MQNRKEKHHVVPLSLWGWDVPSNILNLKRETHRKIHRSQDIPYERIRSFRKKTNGLDPRSNEYKQHYLALLLQFFCGAMLLPAGIIRAQALAMKKLTYYAAGLSGREDKIDECPHANRPFLELIHWTITFVAVYLQLGYFFNIWLIELM